VSTILSGKPEDFKSYYFKDIFNEKFFLKKTDCNKAENIGIIAPYNDQVKQIQNLLSGLKYLSEIEINTVDQFQGLKTLLEDPLCYFILYL
jgi:hypothetical protein